MRRFSVTACIAISWAVCGCATNGAVRPAGAYRRVRNDTTAEWSDAVNDTRERLSGTWANMLNDWNYDREDSFGEIRNAANR